MISTTQGILYIVSGFIIGFNFLLPNQITEYIGIYLLFEGVIFLILYGPEEGLSFVDSGIGIYAILLSFGVYSGILSTISVLYLLVYGAILIFGP